MEFSLKGYVAFIKTALEEGYEFVPFDRRDGHGEKCLLRYDVDASITQAYKMSQAEIDLGIRSTYFLMLTSPLYNCLSVPNSKFIMNIIKSGHRIGLHFDANLYPGEQIQQMIDIQSGILRTFFDCSVGAVSFHQPATEVINNKVRIRQVNAYDKSDMEGYLYVSDSNMSWRGENPLQVIKGANHEKIHLLIHPIWWVGEGNTTVEKWNAAIATNF